MLTRIAIARRTEIRGRNTFRAMFALNLFGSIDSLEWITTGQTAKQPKSKENIPLDGSNPIQPMRQRPLRYTCQKTFFGPPHFEQTGFLQLSSPT